MAGEVQLNEVAEIIMGQSPPGSTYNESGVGLPFFQGVRDFNYRHPSIRVFCSEPTRIARPGDILFSVRAPIGRVNIAEFECAIGRGLAIIRARSNEDRRFIEYVLRSMEQQWQVIEGGGSVFGNATRQDLTTLLLPWPDNPREREAIGYLLGALDDKIELNRRMNQTLEEMARAIFKSWFVDFDPVRAKAAVRREHPDWTNAQVSRAACPNLKPEIAELFPDAFEDSELGEIPKGWKISELGDVADVNWGDTNVTKKSYVEDGYIAYSAKGPDGFLPYHDYDRTGVVLSAIGANSGYTWLALGKWSCIKNTIRFWSTDETLSTEYLFHATHGNHHWPLRGSAQPFISQGDARKVRVLKPPKDLGKLFGQIIRPFHEKVYQSSVENCTLAALRDTLLPKLISGELRVPDAERIVQRATDAGVGSVAATPSARTSEDQSRTFPQGQPFRKRQVPDEDEPEPRPTIDDYEREDVLAAIRELYRDDPASCDREELLVLLREKLGFGVLGSRIRKYLEGDLLAAVRRGVLERCDGEYRIYCRTIEDYERDWLKELFLQAIGRGWIERDEAMQQAARYLGFQRTGSRIKGTFKSLINGLIREGRIETDGPAIRRV